MINSEGSKLSFSHPWLLCILTYKRMIAAIVKSSSDDTSTTVGHLPRELSCLLLHFLTRRMQGNWKAVALPSWIGDSLLYGKKMCW